MQPPTSTQPPTTMPQGAIAVPGLSLRHNFAWTLAGNVVYAGCQWGMLVVLAKLGSPIMVGQFALGLAVTGPVIMFANLSLRAVQATDSKQEYLFGHYLSLRLLTTALMLVALVVITLASGYHRETALVILAVGLAKGFESVSDIVFGLLQQHERMDRIAISMMIKGPLSLLALGMGIWLTGSVLWGTLGLALAWAAILVSYDIRSVAMILCTSSLTPAPAGESRYGRAWPQPNWDLGRLGRLAWLTLPLGLSMMLITLNTSVPRYFIHHYLGERELGIFAAMAYLMVTGGMVVGALGQSASPRLARYCALGDKEGFRRLLRKLLGLGALLGVLGIVVVLAAGKEILTLIYRPEYAERVDVLFWLMLAAGVTYLGSFLGYGLTALRYFRVQMPLYGLVSGSALLLSLLLIPGGGLRGAAQALLISGVVQLGLTLAIIWHELRGLSTNHPKGIV